MSVPDTLLVITPVSPNASFALPNFSARGLTQTLEPWTGIGGDDAFGTELQMDSNGNLIDLSPPQLKLYQTTITCTDVRAPALDGGFRGALVQIQCAAELIVPLGGSPNRAVVAGSEWTDEGGFLHYRPTLLMRITAIKNGNAEWPADYTWMLKAIETKS